MAQALPIHNKARFTGAQTYAEVSVTIIFWYIIFPCRWVIIKLEYKKARYKKTKFGPGEKRRNKK
jgi:hypothetical protein